jgi:hypothetical protein
VDTGHPGSERPTLARRTLSWVIVAAAAGIGLFAFSAWRSVSIEPAAPGDALQRFTEVRSALKGEPIVQFGADGRHAHASAPRARQPMPLSRLRVLAYRAREARLIRAVVPFWFLKLKGPAVQYALRDTGLDLDQLGVTPADLERYGPGVVLDQSRANGDRLLVWTE